MSSGGLALIQLLSFASIKSSSVVISKPRQQQKMEDMKTFLALVSTAVTNWQRSALGSTCTMSNYFFPMWISWGALLPPVCVSDRDVQPDVIKGIFVYSHDSKSVVFPPWTPSLSQISSKSVYLQLRGAGKVISRKKQFTQKVQSICNEWAVNPASLSLLPGLHTITGLIKQKANFRNSSWNREQNVWLESRFPTMPALKGSAEQQWEAEERRNTQCVWGRTAGGTNGTLEWTAELTNHSSVYKR